MTYEFWVTSFNGAGVYSKHKTLRDAKKAAIEKDIQHTRSPLEIERVLHHDNGGWQFWMQQGRRWVPWHHQRGADVRKPSFLVQPEARP